VASLRIQLIAFWLLLLVVCAGLGIVMIVLYHNSAGVQIGQTRLQTQRVCEAIAARYRQSAPNESSDLQVPLLQVTLQLALIEVPHVEGGVWDTANGFVAYAYPTYEGGGAKVDVPEAERPHIAEVAREAAVSQSFHTDVLRGSREALVLTACPLSATRKGAAAWTMTRVPAEAEAALGNLRVGLGVLLAAVLGSGAWLGVILTHGYRHVRGLEATLAAQEGQSGTAPQLARTGVPELDRIVCAVNRYSARLDAAQSESRALLRQQAHNQRLTALGRMTGGIAHEIRNPIATMRLQAENALAASPARHAEALRGILQQIERLDRLVQNLLATVQPLQLEPIPVRMAAWLEERRSQLAPRAEARGVSLRLETTVEEAVFDPLHMGRAVDNLLDNAVRHAADAGHVSFLASREGSGALLLRVVDDGPGVPTELEDHLFEPFATTRAEGTGLGLALAREIALAHGGEVRYAVRDGIAGFELELPWRES
jgi:signal transduction histidine kinase